MNCHNTFPYVYRIYQEKMAGFCDATGQYLPLVVALQLADPDVAEAGRVLVILE